MKSPWVAKLALAKSGSIEMEGNKVNPGKAYVMSLLISILFHTGQPIDPSPRPCRQLPLRAVLEWALRPRVSHPTVHLER